MELTAGLRPQARFLLLVVPRMLAGRCSTSRLASYAMSLTESGSKRLGAWCWERVIRRSMHDERTCESLLDLCIQAGRYDAAEDLANRSYDASGLIPDSAARLTGNLALSNAYASALRIYDRLLRHCGDDFWARSPAPTLPEVLRGEAFRSILAARAECTKDNAANAITVDLSLARLCFAFSAFEPSAALFARTSKQMALNTEDRIAEAYGLLRSGRTDQIPLSICELSAATHPVPIDADWQILLATVLFARGAFDAALHGVEAAVRSRFSGHAESDSIVADCRAIAADISNMPDTISFGDGAATDTAAGAKSTLRKVFVCGNGWSGSGALYDALTEYDCLSEAPETPIDRYLNADTESETMFVQGTAGLGRIWREAREKRRLTKLHLWELFRCHVLGGGAIGYAEHKTTKAASHLLFEWGSRYTGIFRRTFEQLAALPDSASLSTLKSILTDTTESLTGELAAGVETDCVVFNNAVFGRNLDMLEIFRNFRAAVVTRDPLDQYADRRLHDLKHWMTPARFVPFYRENREAFHARRRQLSPQNAQQVREVEFEQFVLNEQYRRSVFEWLLEGLNASRVRRRFEPARSARNVGIHASLLIPAERDTMKKDLKRWRRS